MFREDEHTEFKKTTAELTEAMCSISAILNKHGEGTLYFGVKNDGTPFPFTIADSTLRDVSRKVFEAIKPQIFPSIDETRMIIGILLIFSIVLGKFFISSIFISSRSLLVTPSPKKKSKTALVKFDFKKPLTTRRHKGYST